MIYSNTEVPSRSLMYTRVHRPQQTLGTQHRDGAALNLPTRSAVYRVPYVKRTLAKSQAWYGFNRRSTGANSLQRRIPGPRDYEKVQVSRCVLDAKNHCRVSVQHKSGVSQSSPGSPAISANVTTVEQALSHEGPL